MWDRLDKAYWIIQGSFRAYPDKWTELETYSSEEEATAVYEGLKKSAHVYRLIKRQSIDTVIAQGETK